MPIGSTLSKTSNSRVAALLKSALGSPEIHNHTRLRPVLKYFRKRSAEQLKILEIGCGTGDLLIEICSIGSDFSATGVDIDPASIMLATRHLELISPARGIKFVVGVVILIDVLEHLHETDHVLETVRRRLKPGGTFLVSVPTPMSPRVFGREFHEQVGHVRDGYTRETLFDECSGFRCITYSYNTGPVIWLPCTLSYRFINRIKNYKVQTSLKFLTVPFAMLDFWRPAKGSCSLFAEFVRTD